MPDSRLDRFLAPWVFVLTGILFNILSAVITHYFIGLNNDHINRINRQIDNKQVLIDGQWQAKTEVERKQEFFILLLTAKPTPGLVHDYFQTHIKNLVEVHGLDDFDSRMEKIESSDLNLLLEVSNAAQTTIIDTINNAYFETLGLQESRVPLERSNSRLLSIAIFLQVTGLILVLARDLRRH